MKNCSICQHLVNNPDGGYCYHFKEEPDNCMINRSPVATRASNLAQLPVLSPIIGVPT